MEIVLGRVRTLDERVQHALDSLSPQALAILTRGSFVAGEYIPLRLIIELSENAPLHARLNMYVLSLLLDILSGHGRLITAPQA